MKVSELKQAIEIGKTGDVVGQCLSSEADGSLSAMVGFPAPIIAAAPANSPSGPAIEPR